jgi:hypothetical protein
MPAVLHFLPSSPQQRAQTQELLLRHGTPDWISTSSPRHKHDKDVKERLLSVTTTTTKPTRGTESSLVSYLNHIPHPPGHMGHDASGPKIRMRVPLVSRRLEHGQLWQLNLRFLIARTKQLSYWPNEQTERHSRREAMIDRRAYARRKSV